jgi:hypothetical protein
MTTYPRWNWADRQVLSVELEFDRFAEYVVHNGVWRQRTKVMTSTETKDSFKHWLGRGWDEYTPVGDEFGAWLTAEHDRALNWRDTDPYYVRARREAGES